MFIVTSCFKVSNFDISGFLQVMEFYFCIFQALKFMEKVNIF